MHLHLEPSYSHTRRPPPHRIHTPIPKPRTYLQLHTSTSTHHIPTPIPKPRTYLQLHTSTSTHLVPTPIPKHIPYTCTHTQNLPTTTHLDLHPNSSPLLSPNIYPPIHTTKPHSYPSPTYNLLISTQLHHYLGIIPTPHFDPTPT